MTPQPSATPAQPQTAVSVETAAEFLLDKIKAKKEAGPYEVLLEPDEDGHLPTSTGLEDAIRRRAAGMVPPVVVRGLSAGVKGYRGADGVLFAVEGAV